MSTRRAIILAAGDGSRMGALTADRPKAMLDVGGRLLVDRQLSILHAAGFRVINIVVGHQQQLLRDHLGDRVRFIENVHFRETSSMYSLWLAANELEHGSLVISSGVVFSSALLDRLLTATAPDALLFDCSRPLAHETMKVRIAGPYVLDLGRMIGVEDAAGEAVGIAKVGCDGARRLVRILDKFVALGERMAPAPTALAGLAHTWPVTAVECGGLPWVRIDTPEDLRKAEREVAGSASASTSAEGNVLV